MAPAPFTVDATGSSCPGAEGRDLLERLERTFTGSGSWAPTLPQEALEVLDRSRHPDARATDLVEVLREHPRLAARVLSTARSWAAAASHPLQTLHEAGARFGLSSLRDLVLEAAVHLDVLRVPGHEPAMERLARHSAAVAHVMRAVCRRTRAEPEHAFLCGLLHDVGMAAALRALVEEPSRRGASFEELAPLLDEVHEEAGGRLARLWALPECVQRLIATHHEPSPGGRAEPLNASLVVAEQLCWEAGAGLLAPPPGATGFTMETPEPPRAGVDANWAGILEEARAVLRMDDLALAALRAEAFQLLGRLPVRSAAGFGVRPMARA